MERSLSVLLPVRDVQSTLATTVSELLDVLPELTRHFELLIIDDGSKDATIEVADELATNYPQICVVRHGQTQGRKASIATGLRCSRGEVVFLQDEGCRLALDQLGQLWRALDQHDMVLGCASSISGPRWNRWKNPGPSRQPGFQMGRRKVIEPIQDALTDQITLRDRLERLGYPWCEIEMRNRPLHRSLVPPSAAAGRDQTARPAQPAFAAGIQSRPKAPNYLTKAKDPTFGE